MIGKAHQSCVLVLTDRKSRFNKFRKLKNKSAKGVTKETLLALRKLPKKSMVNGNSVFKLLLTYTDYISFKKTPLKSKKYLLVGVKGC